MKTNKNHAIITSSILFIVLMGIISMLSDMTHEGAKSIYGTFLPFVGASPFMVSFISGFGEFIACSLILLTGYIANKTKKYWTMTIIGYMINLLAIPALALTTENGWIYACGLILCERIGRSIRKPAKSTLVSFVSKNLGEGKTFAFVEFLDQIGAFVGPTILSLALILDKTTNTLESFRNCFLILGIPAILTLLMLLIAKYKYPNPESFEEAEDEEQESKPKIFLDKRFIYYLIAISLCAIGFIDFPLITLYVSKLNIINSEYLPLLYSLAMLVDAFAALLFGVLYDKYGIKVLCFSTFISAIFAIFIFGFINVPMIIIGIVLWGIGMGAQESILKSAVATIVPKYNRAFGFGIFQGLFGLFWFIGSIILGALFEINIVIFITFSVVFQFIAIPFFILASKNIKKKVIA